MTGKEALEIIKGIQLQHIEYMEDENLDGEMEYYESAMNDGSIAENYVSEIEIIEKDLKVIDTLHRQSIPVEAMDEAFRRGIWIEFCDGKEITYGHFDVRGFDKDGIAVIDPYHPDDRFEDCVYYYQGFGTKWAINKEDLENNYE